MPLLNAKGVSVQRFLGSHLVKRVLFLNLPAWRSRKDVSKSLPELTWFGYPVTGPATRLFQPAWISLDMNRAPANCDPTKNGAASTRAGSEGTDPTLLPITANPRGFPRAHRDVSQAEACEWNVAETCLKWSISFTALNQGSRPQNWDVHAIAWGYWWLSKCAVNTPPSFNY